MTSAAAEAGQARTGGVGGQVRQTVHHGTLLVELVRYPVKIACQSRMISTIYGICTEISILKHARVLCRSEERHVNEIVEGAPSGAAVVDSASKQGDYFFVAGFGKND